MALACEPRETQYYTNQLADAAGSLGPELLQDDGNCLLSNDTAVEYVFCKMALGRVHPLEDNELTDPRFDGAMDISVAP